MLSLDVLNGFPDRCDFLSLSARDLYPELLFELRYEFGHVMGGSSEIFYKSRLARDLILRYPNLFYDNLCHAFFDAHG